MVVPVADHAGQQFGPAQERRIGRRRTPEHELGSELAVRAEAIAEGTRREFMESLTTVPLLIIDDFGMRKLPLTAAEDLLEIVMCRYERASNIAQDLKKFAKSERVICVVGCQRHRPEKGGSPIPSLHDAKDSGEIENSCGLLLGLWRKDDEPGTMNIRILKNTKGIAGKTIQVRFNADTMRIYEEATP